MKSKWSGKYMDVSNLLENEEARKGVETGAIKELVDIGLVRIIEKEGTKQVEYSNIFLELLEKDRINNL